MNFDSRFLVTLFKIALFLLSIGMLPKATVWMMTNALEAQRTGFVSYRAINRALVEPRSPKY